jgi:hypothetical protein
MRSTGTISGACTGIDKDLAAAGIPSHMGLPQACRVCNASYYKVLIPSASLSPQSRQVQNMSDDLATRYQNARKHFEILIIDDFHNDVPFNFDEPVTGLDRQGCLSLPFVKDFLQEPEKYDVYRLIREWEGYHAGDILFYDHQEVFYGYKP